MAEMTTNDLASTTNEDIKTEAESMDSKNIQVNGEQQTLNGEESQENPDIAMSGQSPHAANNNDDGSAESKISQKKDATLREFLSKMDDHAPIIPDAVTNYYFTLAGLPPPPVTPLPLARLLALATQKFIADVAADAYQYSRIRASNTSSSTTAGMPGVGPPGTVPGGPSEKGEKGGDKGKNANLGVQRAGFGGSGSGGQGRTVLTMEDLGMSVGEYGIAVRRGEFYR